MLEYFTIGHGTVYELLGSTGTSNGKLYVVLSDNKFHRLTENAIICPIGLSLSFDKDTNSAHHVSYKSYFAGKTLEMTIMVEQLFNVKVNRLIKYKYTLSENIMSKVEKAVMDIMFGRELYTRDQVIVNLYNEDHGIHNAKVEEPEISTQEVYSVDEDKMTIDEYQNYFGKMMSSLPQEEPKVEEKPKHKELHVEWEAKPTKSAKSKKQNPVDRKKYSHIYKNYEEFLMDYYTMEDKPFLKKWKLSSEEVKDRVLMCRQTSRRHGDDQTMWKEAAKERNRRLKDV